MNLLFIFLAVFFGLLSCWAGTRLLRMLRAAGLAAFRATHD